MRNTTYLILAASLICGCQKTVSTTRSHFARGYFLDESPLADKRCHDLDIQEVSIWRYVHQQKRLVCRLVKQRGVVVSVMPTPTQSDAVRQTAQFVRVGDSEYAYPGFFVSHTGELFLETPLLSAGRRQLITEAQLDKILSNAATNHWYQAYLTVEHEAPYAIVTNTFARITSAIDWVGMGYRLRQ